MSRAHQKKWNEVLRKRQMGLYVAEETREELETSAKQLCESPDDEYVTLLHAHGVFNVYNQREFLQTLKLWKQMKCVLLDCNIQEREIAGHKITFFVVQPPEDKQMSGVCPLAAAMGFLVSGFTYICKHKESVDLVKRYLQQ